MSYEITNRAVPYTIIASSPINENWDYVQNALNELNTYAIQVDNKIDTASISMPNGVAGLDKNGKVYTNQLPSQLITSIFVVDNMAQQLSLDATQGDVCIRTDISKTYMLINNTPAQFTNWIEIASKNTGGDIGANPCFTNSIMQSSWEQYADGTYYIVYTPLEHGQGATKYLLVNIKKDSGSVIDLDYTVTNEGTVTINSKYAFSGDIMISNLSGNVKSGKYIPYAILSGSTDAYNDPAVVIRTYRTISLDCSNPLIVVDGMDYLRKINSCDSLTITNTTDGTYVVFADSDKINDNTLQSISYVKKSNYLGVVSNLPSSGLDGQRVYVAYDKSYEYKDNNWVPKAFVPIGEFTQRNGNIVDSKTYNFRENGIDVTTKSKSFDYLYGDIIQGLDVTITSNNISISSGKCFNNQLTTVEAITKTFDNWTLGNNQGCFDSSVIQNEGWGFIYLITSGSLNDIILSFNAQPEIPEGYGFSSFRRIGYFYRTSSGILRQNTVQNKIYLEDTQDFDKVRCPSNTIAIINIECETPQNINFYVGSSLIKREFIQNTTLELPNNVIFQADNEFSKTLLGFIDRRVS